jgi:hypothetical protein
VVGVTFFPVQTSPSSVYPAAVGPQARLLHTAGANWSGRTCAPMRLDASLKSYGIFMQLDRPAATLREVGGGLTDLVSTFDALGTIRP